MRMEQDLISRLRIKLKSFSIPIKGPANAYSDNGDMIKNTGILKLTLNKKHNLNKYHIVCKSVATKMMRIAKKIQILILLMHLLSYCIQIN